MSVININESLRKDPVVKIRGWVLVTVNLSHCLVHWMSDFLTLNLSNGSVSFRFPMEAAINLKAEINMLMSSMRAIAGDGHSTRPEPQQAMEYQYAGIVFLEVFCNPNIYASPFGAKVLVTLRDERMRIITEVELPRFLEDLDEYLARS